MAESSENLIIKILSENSGLSLKQIHLRIIKNGKQCTYQAVHKKIKELEEKNQLTKKGKFYAINLEWLKKEKIKNEDLEKRIKSKIPTSIENIRNLSFAEFTFEDIQSLGEFIAFDFFKLDFEKTALYCRWNYIYTVLGLPKDLVEEIGKEFSLRKVFIACNGKTKWDEMSSETFISMGNKINFNSNVSKESDCFLLGDYVLQIFFPSDHMKIWNDIVKRMKEGKLDVNKLLDAMQKNKSNYVVHFNKNPFLAKELRERTMSFFKEFKES